MITQCFECHNCHQTAGIWVLRSVKRPLSLNLTADLEKKQKIELLVCAEYPELGLQHFRTHKFECPFPPKILKGTEKISSRGYTAACFCREHTAIYVHCTEATLAGPHAIFLAARRAIWWRSGESLSGWADLGQRRQEWGGREKIESTSRKYWKQSSSNQQYISWLNPANGAFMRTSKKRSRPKRGCDDGAKTMGPLLGEGDDGRLGGGGAVESSVS